MRGEAPQGRFNLLVLPFSLAIGLRMEHREQAGGSPQQSAKFLPKTRGELGPPVRDNVSGEAVKAENMV